MLSQLQEKEDCIVYSVGTSPSPSFINASILLIENTCRRQDRLRTHLSKPSFELAHVIASYMYSITPRRPSSVHSQPLPRCQSCSASFIQRRRTRTNTIILRLVRHCAAFPLQAVPDRRIRPSRSTEDIHAGVSHASEWCAPPLASRKSTWSRSCPFHASCTSQPTLKRDCLVCNV